MPFSLDAHHVIFHTTKRELAVMPPRKRGSGLSHQHKSGTGRSKRTANHKIGESKNCGIAKSTSRRKRKSFLEVGTAAVAAATLIICSSVASVSNASDSGLSKSNESYSSVTSLTNSSSLLTITPILDSKYNQKCTQEAADIEINPDAFSETNGRKKRKSNEASKHAQWREVLKAVNLIMSYDDKSKKALVLKGVVDHPKMAKYAKAVVSFQQRSKRWHCSTTDNNKRHSMSFWQPKI